MGTCNKPAHVFPKSKINIKIIKKKKKKKKEYPIVEERDKRENIGNWNLWVIPKPHLPSLQRLLVESNNLSPHLL